MSRAIKFRAWHRQAKSMAGWDVIRELLFGRAVRWPLRFSSARPYPETITFFEVRNPNIFENLDLEVMQFIGLQDSKGVDIYEGDVCRLSIKGLGITVVSEMKFFPDYSMFAFSSVPHYYVTQKENKPMGSSGSSTPWKPYTPGSYKYIEVLGNIHQHPELLEGKK